MILFSFLPVPAVIKESKADPTSESTANSCAVHSYIGYNSTGTVEVPKQIIRPVVSADIKPNKIISNTDKLWLNESLEVFYKVIYKQDSKWKQNYCDVKPKLQIVYNGTLGYSNILNTDFLTNTTPSYDYSNGLVITGSFQITNFDSILNSTYKNYVTSKHSWYSKNFVFRLSFAEEPPDVVVKTSSPFGIAPCDAGTNCPEHTIENVDQNGTGGIGDENIIPFPLLRFNFGSKIDGADLQYVPEKRKTNPYQNFVRLYVDSTNKTVPFQLKGQINLKTPTDKKFSISQNGPSTKVTMSQSNKSITEPKKVNGLIAGVVASKKVIANKDSGTGCTRSSTDTNYTIGTGNETFNYNYCLFASEGYNKIEDGVVMQAGQPGPTLSINVTNNILEQLGALKQVTCKNDQGKDDPQGTNCENDTVNTFDFYHGVGVEKTLFDDTSIKALLINPIMVSGYAIYGALDLVVAYNPPVTFYVEIYPNKKAWEKYINEDPPASVPEAKSVDTSSGVTESNLAQTLYSFIVRVISSIIIFLQSILYSAFAYIIVPILNALLKVRPYQDGFVNVIYPGWLILRNLANIFFIVSLLVVGLRILFQQSAAGTAKNFILRLVIMALLVNFSLVIAQGLVGIADTVQAQFLPANTKIIESLGQKLMVEPLKTFRSETVGDGSEFEAKTAELSLADTIKPIVLFVLSVASFFSFIAVGAFLLVRLVALWVLYMLSPIAYVGFVMDETKTYAKQWWSEFLKYAIITPVLVFFLNIAALMATLFSGSQNSLFKFTDGLADEIVKGALTVISHFIVLFFLYAGMNYARGSGVAGSRAIVNYAQKGFEALTTKPAKWAAGQVKDYAKQQYQRRIEGGMLDPFAYKKAWQESVDGKTTKIRDKRLASYDGRITPAGLIGNTKQALKYLATGARFGQNRLQGQHDGLVDKAAILTDAERDQKLDDRDTDIATINSHNQELGLLNSDRMSLARADSVVLQLTGKIDALNEQRNALVNSEEVDKLRDDSDEARNKGRAREAAALRRKANDLEAANRVKISDLDGKISDASDLRRELEGDISAARGAGQSDVFVPDNMNVGLMGVIGLDSEKVKKDLKKQIEDIQEDLDGINVDLAKDDKRRVTYDYGQYGALNAKHMTIPERESLLAQAEQLQQTLEDRRMPSSLAQMSARKSRENEAVKPFEDFEGEELRQVFTDAMKDNNLSLAAAIAKKIAKEGSFDTLLEENGFKNNFTGFKSFIEKTFAKLSPSVRVQIGSEVGSLNEKNGNMAAGKATTIRNGKLTWRTEEDHQEKVTKTLSGKAPGDVVKMKKWEISTQTANGGHKLYKGFIENAQSMNTEKLKDLKKKMSAKTANHIIKAENYQDLIRGHSELDYYIKEAATGTK